MNAPVLAAPAHAAPLDFDEERDWLNWLAWLETPAGQQWIEEQLNRLNSPLLSKEDDPDYLINF